jgi:hypothetical protein
MPTVVSGAFLISGEVLSGNRSDWRSLYHQSALADPTHIELNIRAPQHRTAPIFFGHVHYPAAGQHRGSSPQIPNIAGRASRLSLCVAQSPGPGSGSLRTRSQSASPSVIKTTAPLSVVSSNSGRRCLSNGALEHVSTKASALVSPVGLVFLLL